MTRAYPGKASASNGQRDTTLIPLDESSLSLGRIKSILTVTRYLIIRYRVAQRNPENG